MSLSVGEISVTREELLRRATALLPVLKERAARTEQLRQIPLRQCRTWSPLASSASATRSAMAVSASNMTRPLTSPGSWVVPAAPLPGAMPSGRCTTGGWATSPSRPRRNSSLVDRMSSRLAPSIQPEAQPNPWLAVIVSPVTGAFPAAVMPPVG